MAGVARPRALDRRLDLGADALRRHRSEVRPRLRVGPVGQERRLRASPTSPAVATSAKFQVNLLITHANRPRRIPARSDRWVSSRESCAPFSRGPPSRQPIVQRAPPHQTSAIQAPVIQECDRCAAVPTVVLHLTVVIPRPRLCTPDRSLAADSIRRDAARGPPRPSSRRRAGFGGRRCAARGHVGS